MSNYDDLQGHDPAAEEKADKKTNKSKDADPAAEKQATEVKVDKPTTAK